MNFKNALTTAAATVLAAYGVLASVATVGATAAGDVVPALAVATTAALALFGARALFKSRAAGLRWLAGAAGPVALVNPTTGLPMADDLVDVGGNLYMGTAPSFEYELPDA